MAKVKFLRRAKEFQPEITLRYLLHQHLSGKFDGRGTARLHASELTKEDEFCPRYYALCDLTDKKPGSEYLSTSSSVTFDIGRKLQDSVVHWFAEMGRAVADWLCLSCNHLHEFSKRPEQCHCGSAVFKAEECRFTSKVTGASAGVDMLVDLGRPKLDVVEIKTIDKDEFKTLAGPLAEHKLRTNLYLRIVSEANDARTPSIDTQAARVLYVSKGGFGCQDNTLKAQGIDEWFTPFKEYPVARDDTETEDLARRATAVHRFRQGLDGVPIGICATALEERAKKCDRCKDCFSGQFPGVQVW